MFTDAWSVVAGEVATATKTNQLGANDDWLKAQLIEKDPPGVVQPFAGTTAPAGWLLCQGQAISRTTYADLFAVIGITYGSGDGTTTFNVPDIRDRTVVGLGSTSDFNALNKKVGSSTVSLSASQNGAHSHGVNDGGHSHSLNGDPVYTSAGGSQRTYLGGGSGQQLRWSAGGVNGSGSNISIQSSGSGAPHNNIQPSIVLNMIIKT